MNDSVFRHLSRIVLKAGRPMRLEALRQLEDSQWLSRAEVAGLQLRKLRKLLDHASTQVPYYRDIFRSSGLAPSDFQTLSDLARLPVLNKGRIRDNLPALIAADVASRDCLPNATSGSTGVTLSFYSDRRVSNSTNALGLRANRWAGWNIGDRQAVLWGAHGDDTTTGLYRKVKNWILHKRLFLSSYEMDKEHMIDYRYKINEFRPRLIEGYASALYLFARFVKDFQLRVYQPRGIIATAETLYPHQREAIESAFHCRVFNRYGSREVSGIAQECEEHQGLHLFAEHVIVEILDENDRPAPAGEVGKIVVTDLDNFAFPFIRYDIGDLGSATEMSCPCGRGLPLLAQVEGRVWDIIIGANGKRLVGTFWLVSGIKGIRQFQVRQDRLGELTILVVGDTAFDDKEKKKMQNRVLANCGPAMQVELRLVDHIPQAESGKHRYIISQVSPFV